MSRLTYQDEKGNWGLIGLDWGQLSKLHPRVYGALCKLKDVEELVDKVNVGEDDEAWDALEKLTAMGSQKDKKGESRVWNWMLERFLKKR